MPVTNEKLLDIITEASYRVHKEIKSAYKSGNLEIYLSSVGMLDFFPREEEFPLYETNSDGKILIFGDAKIKDNEIYGCPKECGIDKDRIELYTDYDAVKKYSFKKYNITLIIG